MKILDLMSEQKCEFCLRRRCTNLECSEEYLIKQRWTREEIEFEFKHFLSDEVSNFVERVERRNKFRKLRYMGTNSIVAGTYVYWCLYDLIYDPDLFNFDSLLHSYELHKSYRKYRKEVL